MAPILSDCEPIEQQIEDRGVGAIGLRGDGGTRRFF
jgi:hypothetical protein